MTYLKTLLCVALLFVSTTSHAATFHYVRYSNGDWGIESCWWGWGWGCDLTGYRFPDTPDGRYWITKTMNGLRSYHP